MRRRRGALEERKGLMLYPANGLVGVCPEERQQPPFVGGGGGGVGVGGTVKTSKEQGQRQRLFCLFLFVTYLISNCDDR